MTQQPGSLFIIGNKRSGTSHLVRLLNSSEEVFVTPESDVMWILLQRYQGVALDNIQRHPWDGALALENTLKSCHDIFTHDMQSNEDIVRYSNEALLRIREQFQKEHVGKPLKWIGDKKPVQHVDPQMREFIVKTFSKAAYIHIIRHPQAVVTSMQRAVTGKMPWMKCWDVPQEELLDRWVKNEQYVLEAKEDKRIPIISITFNEVGRDVLGTIQRVFDFLEVEMTDTVKEYCASTTKNDDSLNTKYQDIDFPLTDEAKQLVDMYELMV